MFYLLFSLFPVICFVIVYSITNNCVFVLLVLCIWAKRTFAGNIPIYSVNLLNICIVFLFSLFLFFIVYLSIYFEFNFIFFLLNFL